MAGATNRRLLLATRYGLLYFGALGAQGNELYSYDASTDSAALVVDLVPGSHTCGPLGNNTCYYGGNPAYITSFGDRLYFRAEDSVPRLWRYVPPSDTATELSPGQPEELTVLGEELFFSAYDAGSDHELWVVRFDAERDLEIFERVADLNSSGSSNPEELTVLGDTLYFVATDETAGRELWALTSRGSGDYRVQVVADTNPTGSSNPGSLHVFDGALYFAADGGDGSGRELWRLNSSGLERVLDLNSEGDANPVLLAVHDARLLFLADDGEGRALWSWDGSSTPQRFAATGQPSELVVWQEMLLWVTPTVVENSELLRLVEYRLAE